MQLGQLQKNTEPNRTNKMKPDDATTPTPRTDADERMAWNAEYMVPPETARKLERELTAMTKQRDAQAERIRYLEGATNHAN
jgi:hypothetical protein